MIRKTLAADNACFDDAHSPTRCCEIRDPKTKPHSVQKRSIRLESAVTKQGHGLCPRSTTQEGAANVEMGFAHPCCLILWQPANCTPRC